MGQTSLGEARVLLKNALQNIDLLSHSPNVDTIFARIRLQPRLCPLQAQSRAVVEHLFREMVRPIYDQTLG